MKPVYSSSIDETLLQTAWGWGMGKEQEELLKDPKIL